jgi:ribonuclease-3
MRADRLEQRLEYRFVTPALLIQALTHRSCGVPNNERLEFLGDSVLNCAVSAALHSRFPGLKEGELSRLRANLVCQDALCDVARSLSLQEFIRLGEGELKSGGMQRPSILADTVEAILGAVFLDGGYAEAEAVTLRIFAPLFEAVDPKAHGKDAKTLLQEVLQSRRIAVPTYTVVATRGADHSREFDVECTVPQIDLSTTGTGLTRRAAEQEAAHQAYKKLQKR